MATATKTQLAVNRRSHESIVSIHGDGSVAIALTYLVPNDEVFNLTEVRISSDTTIVTVEAATVKITSVLGDAYDIEIFNQNISAKGKLLALPHAGIQVVPGDTLVMDYLNTDTNLIGFQTIGNIQKGGVK